MLSPIEAIIEDARAGKMFILVDDEQRENEGDLIIPAQMANADAINFMAKHGRGLICLALTVDRAKTLHLSPMAARNEAPHQTAFTVSIEAASGVTTGISAADRARTVAVAIDPQAQASDLVSPGHVFPLVARDGGVLVRAGHTEAAVDIAKLAGLNPSGVICEIMNDDGSMARLPDLVTFAKQHGMKIGSIASLIAYRRRSEKLVECVAETQMESDHGGLFTLRIYVAKTDGSEHVALIKGTPDLQKPVYVRMHALDILHDVLGDRFDANATDLHATMRRIAEHGSGVVVLLRESQRPVLRDRVQSRISGQTTGQPQLRDVGIGAQILLDLGVRDMILLSRAQRPVVGLEGYGLRIVGYDTP